MAQRVLKEGGVDDLARVAYAFRLATARPPSAAEVVVLQQRIQQLRATYTAKPEAAQELLKVGEHVRDETLIVTDHAAYTVLCNLLFNLDEVITRE